MKEAYKCFAVCFLCDRAGHHEALMDYASMGRCGKDLQAYQEGKRRLSRGFRPEQFLAYSFRPVHEYYKHKGLWRANVIAVIKQTRQ